MRQKLYSAVLIVASLAFAGDGRTPRTSPSDYPVHQETAAANLAAVRVSPEQLKKTFPAEFAQKYVVVEVAIYPKAGSIDVNGQDFTLRLADGEARPDTPDEIAGLWRPKAHPDVKTGGPHVTTETGVIVANGTDPMTGRRTTATGTYEKVGVTNAPNQTVQYPGGNSADADRIEAQLDKWELPNGKTASPVAGYLYFPVPQKKQKGALELQYAHESESASLSVPAPGK